MSIYMNKFRRFQRPVNNYYFGKEGIYDSNTCMGEAISYAKQIIQDCKGDQAMHYQRISR